MPIVPQLTSPSPSSIIDDQKEMVQDRQRGDFVSTLETVAPINPDQFAKATQLEKLSGIPADILHQHREQMDRLLQGNKYAGVYDQYRRTAQALAQGRTAALAQDDIDNLTRIENARQISRFNDQSAGEKVWGAIKQAFQGADIGRNLSYADKLENLRSTFDAVDAEVARATLANELPYQGKPGVSGFANDYLQSTPEDRAAMRERLLGRQAEAIADAVQTHKDMSEAPVEPGAIRYHELGGETASSMATAIAQNPGYAFRSAIGSAAASAPMLVAGALGGPLAAGAVEFGMESDSKLMDVLQDAGINLQDPKSVLAALQDDELMGEARRKAALKAAGTTAVDVLGMAVAGRLLVPKAIGGRQLGTAQREMASLAVQFPVQGALGAASEAAGQFAAEGEVKGGDVLMEAVAGAAMTGPEVAVFGGRRIIESISEGLQQSRQARQAKTTLDEMAESSVESKLRGRDADAFRGVAENQLIGSDFETISIPATALNSLNQDGELPVLPDLLSKVAGLTEQYAEAEARGGSVSMKTADYLAYFADYHEQLGNSIRTKVDGMSVEESEVWQAAQEQQIASIQEAMANPPSEFDDAFVQMMGELQQAGYRRADAEQYVALHLSALSTLAERSGNTLGDLLQRFPLDVRNEPPADLRAIPVDDVQLALQSLRAGEVPTNPERAANVDSLRNYLETLGVEINELDDAQVMGILRDPESVQGVQLEQTGDPKQPRGFITFDNTKRGAGRRNFQITVTGRRDLSTLLHEFGHFYLEVIGDLAADPKAPQQIKDDVASIRKWTGAKPEGPFEVEQHEQFARGFESYLSDGKAPNPELAGAFARFKRWIIAVYKDLRRLNVELSSEIRGVMDRIVATDDQIRAAEQVVQAIPMFETAKKAGMTDAEFQAYREQVELAHADATTTVEQQIIREEERRNSKWWSEQQAKVAVEVAEEIDTLPVYQAIRALRNGVMPDGTERKIKMNTSQLKDLYGQAVVRKLAFMHEKGGTDLDLTATMLNYQSGDEMVKAILAAPSRGDTIKAETQIRMEERYGPKKTGEAAERAMDAVHNEKRAAVLLKELNALGKQGNRNNITSNQVLKKAAERIMQARKVRDIQPFEYQRSEATAGRRAFELAAKGDLEGAYEAKQQQLMNFHLWREALKARDGVDTIVERMKKFNKTSTRTRLGKAGHDYLDQVDAVMEQYEFRNVSLRDLDKRVSFSKWYSDQIAAGNEPDVPEFVLQNMSKTNYRELSFAQLEELDDFVQNVAHLAGLKNKLLASDNLRTFYEAVDDLTDAAYSNNEKRRPLPIDKSTMTALQNLGHGFGGMNASLLKMEQIVDWLDGGDVNGPWHTRFYEPFVQAQVQENDINRDLTTKLMANVEKHQKANGAKSLKEKHFIRSINQTLSKNAIIAAALNVGNEGNRSKLLRGYGWEEHQLQEILSYMNEADWQFVQDQWDLVESLWPQIEQLERDLNGIPPEKVEPTKVSTEYGEFSGGYWPLAYDTSSPAYAGVANTLSDGGGLFESTIGRATTPRGHTKARVDGFAAPILLDTSIIAGHLGQVVHDLTHRRAIMDAAKLMGNAKVKQSIIDTLGDNVAGQFMPWVRGVANDLSMDTAKGVHWWTNGFRQLGANLSIAWMGFSVTTGIQQVMGYLQSMEHLAQTGGRRFLFKGLREFAMKPFETVDWVNSISGEMRNRNQNLDNNIRETIRKSVGDTSAHAVMQRLAFKHISMIQALVDYPTFLGGYHQAIDAGESHEVAVRSGERAVRLSQMAGGAKDLAAVQRNTVMRPFTIVYSYFNLLYNRQADLVHSMKTAQGVQDYLRAFERTMWLIIIPSMLGPLLGGRGPEEDEDWKEWMALKIATYPFMGIPLVRDAASSIESGWAYSGATPIGDVFKSTTRLAHAATQDEVDAEKLTLATMDAVGIAFGLPTAQPKRSVKYLFGVQDGSAPSEDIIDWTTGLMLGPPAK